MQINRAYRLAIYPNQAQEARLIQIIDGCRYVWNHYLDLRKATYLESKESLTYVDCAKDLTGFKKQEGMEWLDSITVHALQQSLRDLDVAYNRFFRKQARFPKFKSRKNAIQSFRKPADWKLVGNKIRTERDCFITARGTLPPSDAVLKSLTVKRENGRWYAVILTEQEITPETKTGPSIGIDLGITDLAITSDGVRYPNIRPRRSLQRQMKKAQQDLARKQKGSRRRQLSKQRLQRLHTKIANQRKNHIHQTSHRITSENQAVIVCEDLAVKNMMRNHCLAGSIADVAWGELLRQTEYKQIWRGGIFATIDRFFPSSKTCSECNFILDRLPLHIRFWTCPRCSAYHDRDENASKVILKQYRPEEPVGVEGKESSRSDTVRVTCPVNRRDRTGIS